MCNFTVKKDDPMPLQFHGMCYNTTVIVKQEIKTYVNILYWFGFVLRGDGAFLPFVTYTDSI